jgi:hypothetical protein
MLTKPSSFNNKLILEAYAHTDVKAEVKHGWATPNQKTVLKGLKLLVQMTLSDGTHIPAGSTAYLKEESLHTQQWAKNKLKSDTLPGEFILVTMNEVEYIVPPEDGAA